MLRVALSANFETNDDVSNSTGLGEQKKNHVFHLKIVLPRQSSFAKVVSYAKYRLKNKS